MGKSATNRGKFHRLAFRLALALIVSVLLMMAAPDLVAWMGPQAPPFFFALAIFGASLLIGVPAGALTAALLLLWQLNLVFGQGAGSHERANFFMLALGAGCALALSLAHSRTIHSARLRDERMTGFAGLLDLITDSARQFAVCILDTDGRVLTWNKGNERLYGWTESSIVNRQSEIFFTQEDRATDRPGHILDRTRKDGRVDLRLLHVRKDGTQFLAELSMTALRSRSGRLIGFSHLVRDVTEEVAEAGEREAREALLQSILAAVPDAMLLLDRNGHILSFSAAAELMFGYQENEVLGQGFDNLLHASDQEKFRQISEQRFAPSAHPQMGFIPRTLAVRKDGALFPVRLTINMAVGGGERYGVVFAHDLTQLELGQERSRQLQEELLQISRASAMGAMASTLAHELSQPLAAISNYAQAGSAILARQDMTKLDFVQKALENSSAQAVRAGQIVRRIREFLDRGIVEMTVHKPLEMIEEAISYALPLALPKHIELLSDVPDDISDVLADSVQISQVLFNLIRNSIDALGTGNNGRIQVRAANSGNMIRFSVIDNGPGLSRDIVQRLFEAFATTKSEGLGLGLSVCRTIVEAHGGNIWVVYSGEHGTEMAFTLSAVDRIELNQDEREKAYDEPGNRTRR